MKIKLILVLLLLTSITLKAQESNQNLTLTFDKLTIEKAFEKIEENSNYTFFYLKDWIVKKTITKTFVETSIENILKELLKNTEINYFIYNNTKIVLTKNSIIYDSLPENFLVFEREVNEVKKDNNFTPIFYEKNQNNSDEIVKIGKANKNSNSKIFVLKGFITNKETNDPIKNVAIVIKGEKKGTTTNSKGYYSLRLPMGINILEFGALGKENVNKKILIYNDGELNLQLIDSYEVLDEIVIRSNKDVNLVKAISGVIQIEVSKIKTIPLILGEQDLLKVATTMPGISKAGEGSSGFNVRGGKIDQNLVLLDNTVIYNPNHFLGMFSGVNPFSTKSINIYKGGIPAEYGGRLSSVFEMTTKTANKNVFSGEGSIGPVMSNLVLEIPISKEKSSLLIGARSTYSDWILKTLDSESLKNSEASFNDLILKIDHKINENNSLAVNGYLSNDKYRITSDSLFSYSNKTMSINWTHEFKKKDKLNVSLSNSQYGFKINFNKENKGGFDLGYNINETELKINVNKGRNNSHQFNYGLSSKMYNINPGNLNPIGDNSIYTKIDIPKEKALESALYISDNIKVNDKLQIDFGIRYSNFLLLGPSKQRIYKSDVPKSSETVQEEVNYSSNEFIKNYGGLELRMSTRLFLLRDFSIKASYNTNNQYIHTLSNNTTASPTDTWKLSDSNIKPQFAQQVSLGLYKNLNEGMYEVVLEGYFKKLENILDYKTGAKLLLNETIETKVLQGEGKSYGVEFLIKKTRGKLNGWVGYTYSRSLNKFSSKFASEIINNGNYFPSNYDKPHDFSLVANYKLTERFSLSVNGVYQTGRPVTFPTGRYTYNNIEYVTYSDRNKFRIPNYYRLDIGLNIEGNHKIKKLAHSFWNISIYNVLGRNNPYSVFFVTEDSEIRAYQSSIFSRPIPTISYNFKF